MPRKKRDVSRCLLAFLLGTLFVAAGARESVSWTETFNQGRLDLTHWQPTAEGDCRRCMVSVVDEDGESQRNQRLRISLDTRGTRDDTVKFAGIRARRPIHLHVGTQIFALLDWNDQANGSYLSAALIFSAHKTSQNPLKTSEWLSIEYIGVPPMGNARMAIRVAEKGQEQTLYSEGWPDTHRTGRKIAQQEMTIEILDELRFRVRENGQVVYESTTHPIPFKKAYLYLQASSHSNYASRSIDFDDIRVSDLNGESSNNQAHPSGTDK